MRITDQVHLTLHTSVLRPLVQRTRHARQDQAPVPGGRPPQRNLWEAVRWFELKTPASQAEKLARAQARGDMTTFAATLDDAVTDPNRPAADGYTALTRSIANGDATAFDLLLRHSAVNPAAPSAAGVSPLAIAVQGRNAPAVRALVARTEVDPSAPDRSGDTALICAARVADLDVLNALLDSPRVDRSATNRRGHGALHVAAALGHYAVVQVLISRPACGQGHKERTRALLRADAEGHTEVAVLLFQSGTAEEMGPHVRLLARSDCACLPAVANHLLTSGRRALLLQQLDALLESREWRPAMNLLNALPEDCWPPASSVIAQVWADPEERRFYRGARLLAVAGGQYVDRLASPDAGADVLKELAAMPFDRAAQTLASMVAGSTTSFKLSAEQAQRFVDTLLGSGSAANRSLARHALSMLNRIDDVEPCLKGLLDPDWRARGRRPVTNVLVEALMRIATGGDVQELPPDWTYMPAHSTGT